MLTSWTNEDEIFLDYTLDIEDEMFLDECLILFSLSLSDEDTWKNTLQEVDWYVDEHKELPSSYSKDACVKELGKWITLQKKNYKQDEQMMTNPDIRILWEMFVYEYPFLFPTNMDIWRNTFHKVKRYRREYQKLPDGRSKDKSVKQLGMWISRQKKMLKENKQVMTNPEIREQWKEFLGC